MSFFEWIDDGKKIEDLTSEELKEDLRNAHCRAHIARNEYKVLLELMEAAGERERKAEAEVSRLERLILALK